jgi:Xaa-Pro aminopeptidase
MRTMHPVLKRGALFWDRDMLPPACYAARFARIRSLIAEEGDDAWLLHGDVERYGPVAYFSNFLPRTRSAIALVPCRGDPAILVAVGPRDVPAARTLTWIEDVRPLGDPARQVCALIGEKGLAQARIGLVGIEESLALPEWSEIAARLPEVQWRSRSAAAMGLRQAKDRFEQAALRRSARVVVHALDAVPRLIRPGMTARELAAGVDRQLRLGGAEDVRILIAAGAHCGRSLRPAADDVLHRGGAVMLYVAGETQRYWAEGARTFVLGRASPMQQALARRAAAALAAMQAGMAPGALMADIHARAEAAVDDAELRASANAYGYGHGIGLDAEEAPCVLAGSEERIVDGAALALRVIGHSGGQGIAMGHVVVAGADGVEALIEAPGVIECGER